MSNKKFLLSLILLTLISSFACVTITGARPEDYTFPTYGPLDINPKDLPEAQKGEPYSVEIRISQNETPVGDMSIASGALPAGLEFDFISNEDMAIISGVPEEAGAFDISISAWCFGTNVSGQTITKEYQIVVGE
ncbi:MAG: hypothetical protein LC099_04405 [Anaerolineales bacterium]|nr:hypothetical protein [Anaerolineales bacterium]